MRTMCEVHIDDEDRKANTQWIKAEHPPWENGERLYKIHCSGCHRIDGVAATGPAFNLIWNKDGKTHSGENYKGDESYIQESIWYPEKVVVQGYGPVSKMNSFKGILGPEDVAHVIAYMKRLQNPAAGEGESEAVSASTEAADSDETQNEDEATTETSDPEA